MFKLENEDSRLNIAAKLFGWKKATFKDVAFELQTSEKELLEYSDEDYLELMFYYANSVSVCS